MSSLSPWLVEAKPVWRIGGVLGRSERMRKTPRVSVLRRSSWEDRKGLLAYTAFKRDLGFEWGTLHAHECIPIFNPRTSGRFGSPVWQESGGQVQGAGSQCQPPRKRAKQRSQPHHRWVQIWAGMMQSTSFTNSSIVSKRETYEISTATAPLLDEKSLQEVHGQPDAENREVAIPGQRA